ncbi:hypothetical protein quinque_014466 [Culex quinquefasciatus]
MRREIPTGGRAVGAPGDSSTCRPSDGNGKSFSSVLAGTSLLPAFAKGDGAPPMIMTLLQSNRNQQLVSDTMDVGVSGTEPTSVQLTPPPPSPSPAQPSLPISPAQPSLPISPPVPMGPLKRQCCRMVQHANLGTSSAEVPKGKEKQSRKFQPVAA